MPRILPYKPIPIDQDPQIVLSSIRMLFDELNEQNIRYCHWKSNARLDKALRGETDFDLLIDRDHQELFNKILGQYNVKHVRAAVGKDFPGVEHWIGFDAPTGNLFHLHVHYILVLGEQFVKNYHLPLEKLLLDNTKLQFGIKIPEPEIELIILSLRSLFKYRDRDAIRDFFASDNMGIPEHIRKEITWLLTRISAERFSFFLNEVSTIIPVDAVQEFLRTFVSNPGAWMKFIILRSKFRNAMNPYQREKRHKVVVNYFKGAFQRKIFPRIYQRKRMTLLNRGIRIAFIGTHGSGKSTLIKNTAKWLSWRFTVRTFYMGTTHPSFRTSLLKILAKSLQIAESGTRRVIGSENQLFYLSRRLKRYSFYLRYLSEGRDRYIRYLRSCEEAARGHIVLYDRYPLNAVRLNNRFVDGPRIKAFVETVNDKGSKAFLEKITSLEEKYYRHIEQPDYIFMLQTSPQVSLSRKPDHQSQILDESYLAFLQMDKAGIKITEINTDQPIEQTILQIRSNLWQLI